MVLSMPVSEVLSSLHHSLSLSLSPSLSRKNTHTNTTVTAQVHTSIFSQNAGKMPSNATFLKKSAFNARLMLDASKTL